MGGAASLRPVLRHRRRHHRKSFTITRLAKPSQSPTQREATAETEAHAEGQAPRQDLHGECPPEKFSSEAATAMRTRQARSALRPGVHGNHEVHAVLTQLPPRAHSGQHNTHTHFQLHVQSRSSTLRQDLGTGEKFETPTKVINVVNADACGAGNSCWGISQRNGNCERNNGSASREVAGVTRPF